MPKTLSEATVPKFPTDRETLDLIELTRSALPRGPLGDELAMHLIYDVSIAAAADQSELDNLLEAFGQYAVNDILPPGTPTASDLAKSLRGTGYL